MSTESSVAASTVIPVFSFLYKIIAKATEDEGRCTRERSLNLTAKTILNTRDINKIAQDKMYSVATLLDPRFKRAGFDYVADYDEAVNILKTKATEIENFSIDIDINSVSEDSAQIENDYTSSDDGTINFFKDVEDKKRAEKERITTSSSLDKEIEDYLKDESISCDDNPLEYWKLRKHIFPTLHILAIKYLGLIVNSVPCERLFSRLRHVINDRRCSLKTECVNKIAFVQQNVKLMDS